MSAKCRRTASPSTSVPAQIALLRHDLALPEAQDPETRLRILTILGMLEVNYDSGMARKTWTEVEALALRQHHYLLASRAIGEQGIAAFFSATSRPQKRMWSKPGWSRRPPILALTFDTPACMARAWWNCTNTRRPSDRLNEAIKVAKEDSRRSVSDDCHHGEDRGPQRSRREQGSAGAGRRGFASSEQTIILPGISMSFTRPGLASTREWVNGIKRCPTTVRQPDTPSSFRIGAA